MRWLNLVLVAIVGLSGCSTGMTNVSRGRSDMILAIRWQRLVDDEGKTCDRCGGTREELGKAVGDLKRSLGPLGIRVALEEKPLTARECMNDIMESNRIWIADRPLEEWLGAEVGATVCGACCAQLGETVECRTTSMAGHTYETIPATLIVKAGLLAASTLIAAPSAESCCPEDGSSDGTQRKCCP